MTQRVAIVGSRDWRDEPAVAAFVASLEPGAVVVTGGARGVDTMAETHARRRGLEVVVILPDWERHGRSAGMIRNADIVAQATEVVAFWDGASRGTKNTIARALQATHIRRLTVIKPAARGFGASERSMT